MNKRDLYFYLGGLFAILANMLSLAGVSMFVFFAVLSISMAFLGLSIREVYK